MVEKRFKYYSTSQMIVDDLTGYSYYGNDKICKLLNQESDRADKIAEKYFDLLFNTSYKKYYRNNDFNDPLNKLLYDEIKYKFDNDNMKDVIVTKINNQFKKKYDEKS